MKILVTGSSSGLGFEIAQYLSGSHEVLGCARRSVKNNSFKHISAVDFHDTRTWDALELGVQDALINNVGIADDGLLATQSEEKISELIHVNLIATLILTKRYVRERLAMRKSGVIINISSIIGLRGYTGLVAYAASKGGLDSATRALARELGPKGFRVNSILPGYMKTDMGSSLTKAQMDQIIRRTPLGRLVTVQEVAKVVDFLISENASAITGQNIVVDGGITI